ncbi:hypothetical protein [Rossellomorea vietnamensis]|nr:hypothetical protein [Rossellomorea vietnamensis]MCC5801035.1 hypothetical protein [Rossellomorea vietnamensis]
MDWKRKAIASLIHAYQLMIVPGKPSSFCTWYVLVRSAAEIIQIFSS